jgi:hypothetical protein
MKIQLSGVEFPKITIRDLYDGYVNNDEEGVVGYGGKLNIRPAYQREFIYNDKKRNEVVKTVNKNFPLNTMYWAKTNEGNFEMIDGQQRTLSICQYIDSDFSVELDGVTTYFHSLSEDKRDKILDYPLSIYVCTGTYDEKIDWFNIINIAGEELTKQELRNANFTGTWLTDAKRWFSKTGAPAVAVGEKYISARRDRQEYLELAICWIVGCTKNDDKVIEDYMSKRQKDQDASALWDYFQAVIHWVEETFPKYNKVMKGVEWGELYNKNKDCHLDPKVLAEKVQELFENEEVDNQRYIYDFVLINDPKVGDDRKLSKRDFPDSIKQTKYAQQQGKCAICGEHFEIDQMQADHMKPWSKGGRTTLENCQMLCTEDNLRKAAQVL